MRTGDSPLWRNSDPDTSRAAGRKAKANTRAEDEVRILKLIEAAGPDGLIDEEGEAAWGGTGSSYRRIRVDLERRCLIYRAHRRRTTLANCPAWAFAHWRYRISTTAEGVQP